MTISPTLEQRLFQEFSPVHEAVAAQLQHRFPVLKPHAAGGFGLVYYAQDHDGNEKAIKIYAIPKKGNERVDAVVATRGLDALKRHEKYADRFRHTNIMHILGSGVIDILGNPVPYVEMEWIEGDTLSIWLQKYVPCSQTEFAAIAQPLVEAVALLHKEGVAHLDIKPDNIMIDTRRKNRPVLTDYNNAEETDKRGFVLNRNAGLPSSRYSAPEAESRGELSHRTDIYASGLVFCEIFTGENPKINKEPLDEFIQQNIPFRYRSVLRRCLEEDPTNRHQNAAELSRALKKAEHYWRRKAIGTSLLFLLSIAGYAGYAKYTLQQEKQKAEASIASIQATNSCKIFLEQEDANTAQQQCEQALQYNSQNRDAQLFLGHSFLAQGKSDKAREVYAALLTTAGNEQPEQKTTLLQALRERSLWLKENKKTTQAIDAFLLLSELDGKQKAFYLPHLIDLLIQEKRYEEVRPFLEETAQFSYDAPKQYVSLAKQAFELAHYFAAQQEWQRAVNSTCIAITLDDKVKQRRKEDAENHRISSQLHGREQEWAQHHFFLAELYMKSENYFLAEQEIKKGNSIVPESPEAFTTLARLWQQQGKYAAAEQVLYRAVQLYNADIARARVQEITFDEKSLRSNEREIEVRIYSMRGSVIKVYTTLREIQEVQGKQTQGIESKIHKVESQRAAYERKYAPAE